MSDWLTLVYIIIALLALLITFFQIWKRPKLEITPISEKSYFYRKCQFNRDKNEIGEQIGTVLELCLTIENRGRGEAKVKKFYINIPNIIKGYKEVEHMQRNANGRIPPLRTCPSEQYAKGKTVYISSPPKELLVDENDIIIIPAHHRFLNRNLYFHIEDNIREDKELIECDLKLSYGRREAEARFNLKIYVDC